VQANAPLTNVAAVATISGVTNEVNTSDNTFTLSGISTTGGTPDLSVTLNGTDHIAVRTPTTVTLDVSNSEQKGVIASEAGDVTVTLPDNLQLVSPPPGCTVVSPTSANSPASFTCPVSALNPGANEQFEFEVMAPEPILAPTAITAQVNVPGDVDTANNATEMGDIYASGSPDLTTTIEAPPSVPINKPTSVTVTVSNSDDPGVSTASEGQVTVTLPDGVELVPDSLPEGCTATDANTLTCTVSNLKPGDSTGLEFDVIVTKPIQDAPITIETSWDVDEEGEEGNVITVKGGGTGVVVQFDLSTAAAQPVPALSDTALLLLVLAMAGGAALGARRKQ